MRATQTPSNALAFSGSTQKADENSRKRRRGPNFGNVQTGLALPLQPFSQPTATEDIAPQFKGILTSGRLNRGFNWLEKQPRGIELIIEDILGFAVLRSVLDTLRGVFYGKGEPNWSAGSERFRRETISVFTDLFIPGVAALIIGKVMDSVNGGFSGRFGSLANTQILKNIVDKLPEDSTAANLTNKLATTLADASGNSGDKQLIDDLTRRLIKPLSQQVSAADYNKWLSGAVPMANQREVFTQRLNELTKATKPTPLNRQQVVELLKEFGSNRPKKQVNHLFELMVENQSMWVARKLGLNKMDISVGNLHTDIPSLLEETTRVFDELPAAKNGLAYQRVFNQPKLATYLKNTIKNRKLQFVGLLAGVVTTALAPNFNHYLTKKFHKTEDYPAAEGLFQKKHIRPDGAKEHTLLKKIGVKAKERLKKIAPFVTENLEEGNPLPLLGAATPLAVAAGVVDTVNLKFRKPFGKSWKHLYDFGKKFPYVGQQQIASLYAILIAARIFSARVDHEYYERVIEGATGWGIWILGSPFLKKLYAMGSAVFTNDKQENNPLIKQVGKYKRRVLRTANDIRLLPTEKLNGANRQELIKKLKVASRGALISNVLLLGIIEPVFAIFLTKKRSNQQERNSWKEVLNTLSPLETVPKRSGSPPVS